jgi:bifunctional DNA primase/polymerase-like protein/AAA domain-containing protein
MLEGLRQLPRFSAFRCPHHPDEEVTANRKAGEWRVFCPKGCRAAQVQKELSELEAIEAAQSNGHAKTEELEKPLNLVDRLNNPNFDGHGRAPNEPNRFESSDKSHGENEQTARPNSNGKPKASLNGSTLPYAIAYARRGFGVFPVHDLEADRQCSCGKLECQSGGKHPRQKDWQKLATTDETQIGQWWRDWPHANIGVKCGADSNLTVLDVDGEVGRETLRTLELERGELPETPVAITGSGGAHYYFTFEEGLHNAVRFAPGLDIRTEGGLVVGVGSRTKQPYAWEAAFALGDDLRPARMPDWLADLIRTANAPLGNGQRAMVPRNIHELAEGSGRNNLIYKLGRSLKAQGFSPDAIGAALSKTNQGFKQPFPPAELAVQIAHIIDQPDRAGFGLPAIQNGNGTAVTEARLDVPSGLVALNIEELLQRQTEPREFVLEPILKMKDLAMIYSWRGVGKTLVALEMAYAMSAGGKCLKWQSPRPIRVLYIDGELPLEVIKERVARLAVANDKEPEADFLQFITPDVQERPIPNLSDPKAQALIDQIIVDKKIEVLFIDSISTLCSSGRENEAESWLPIQEWALRLRRRGVTVIFVHHAGKGGAQRGTSRREDILDTVIHLVHPSDYRPEEGSRFEVHFEKTRAVWGEALRPFEAKLEIVNGIADWTMRDVEDLNHSRAQELFGEGMSIRDVAEALDISKSTAARLKTKLNQEARA